MKFQYNAWYVAALPSQINRELIRRTILSEPVLLFRREDGTPVAIKDRCPHRFAPLSLGSLIGDAVQCKYHGLRFGSDGKCVLNPHGPITQYMAVRKFPIVERHDLCWIWMGNPDQANTEMIPDMSYLTERAISRSAHSYLKTDYRYDVLIDNLMDLSHAEYLHVGSLSGGSPESVEYSVTEQKNEVIFTRKELRAPPFPTAGTPNIRGLQDVTITIHWHVGQVIKFELRSRPSNDPSSEPTLVRFAHIATPETASSTHYFMSVTRYENIEDKTLDGVMKQLQVSAIDTEDGPMLQAVDREMEGVDLLELRPVSLPSDEGALRVRRVMRRLLKQEEDGCRGDVGKGAETSSSGSTVARTG